MAFRFLLPLATGILLSLGFPPFNVMQAGWLGLIPLLFALDDCAPVVGAPFQTRPGPSRAEARSHLEAFRRGYVAGLVFFGLTVWWTIHVTLVGMIALIAFLALYFGIWAACFTWLLGYRSARPRAQGAGDAAETAATTTDSVLRNILVAVLGSAGWVTLEWLRGKVLMGGFPWNFLGVTQHQALPLIQFASVTGVYGVSGLLCFVNITFYLTVRRFLRQMRDPAAVRRLSWEFYLAMMLVCGAFLHGIRVIQRAEGGRKLRVALVQGNIPQTLKFEPEQEPMIIERYRSLTEAILAAKPDLIIWPESATPGPARFDPESWALVTDIVTQAHAPLLTGTFDLADTTEGRVAYNAAMLFQPDGGPVQVYRKIHLVPFGEYAPWRKVLPFMKRLTPISESLERGSVPTLFRTQGLRFGAVICFEDIVPSLYRSFVQSGVDFMVNVTNDAWFKQSPAAESHLANAIFRAVENRRPLLRATNNGVTCVVNEFGLVWPRLEPFGEGSLNCELTLPASEQLTYYTTHGDVFVGVCAAIVLAAALWRAAARRRFVSGSA